VLSLVREAVEKFFKENISELIPEVGSNFAVALPYALGVEEVAGVEGRIVRVRGGIHAHCPWFGVSSHVARFLLAIREHDPSINAAMNICLTEAIKEACESLFDIVVYDRGAEPREIKAREGGTMEWIASQVMQGRKSAPDVVLDWGEVGKEQMARVLARSSEELVEKILRIHHSIKEV
jgi:hydroxymethylpyrimidine/phosphomethylpyrimidine kinase